MLLHNTRTIRLINNYNWSKTQLIIIKKAPVVKLMLS